MNEEKKAVEATNEELEKVSGGKSLGDKHPSIKYVHGIGTFCTNFDCTWSDDYLYTARTGSNRCPVCGSKVVALFIESGSSVCPNPDCDFSKGISKWREHCPCCGSEMVNILAV